MKHTVTLRNGVQVPALGLGTWFLGENKSAREREQESLRAGVAAGMTPVSYTHLDVYKRQDLYEAASIDGAGKWRQFFSITIPLITPVIFYNFVTQLCNKFQEFNGPFIVTQGGPLLSLIHICYVCPHVLFIWKWAYRGST